MILTRVSFLSWLIRRWWFWIAVVPLLLWWSTLLSFLLTGKAVWSREQAAARAADMPCSLAELAAGAPQVDARRQERLWQWAYDHGEILGPGRSVPLGWTSADFAKPSAELAAILDDGPVECGISGWFAADVATRNLGPGFPRVIWVSQLDMAAANYRDQALGRGDAAGLRHLDQLYAATRTVHCFADAWNRRVVERTRDQAYVALVAQGRVDAARLDAWLAEPADAQQSAITALQGERVLCLVVLAERKATIPLDDHPTLVSAVRLACDLLVRQHLAAQWSHDFRAAVDGLQHGADPGPCAADQQADWRRDWYPVSVPSLGSFTLETQIAINRQRMARAAACAVQAWQGAGALPLTALQVETVLGRYLHAGAPLLPPLVYERLSATRFRLGLDPHGTLPPGVATIMAGDSLIGQPARLEPLCTDRWSCELDCVGAARPRTDDGP